MDKDHHRIIQALTRRGFIGKIIGAIATFVALALFIPLAGYTLFSAFRRKAGEWVRLFNPNQLKPESPVNVELVTTTKDGWRLNTSVKTVWMVKKRNGEVVAYSPLCTHLGCGYRWKIERKEFFCPCHASVFDMDGNVLSGPAPRPLDTLPVKIKENRIWTIYKEFKAGTSKKIEL